MAEDQALPLPDGVAAHLIDLDTSIRAAADLVARGRAAYDNDFLHRLAAEAISNRIGEAVGNIDESWRDLLPAIPWRAMRTNRNFVVHVYHAIDYARLWNTLVDDVPHVAELLSPYIKAAYAALAELPESE
ncbi:MAG: HepT-like ribonuclease domain-containing protein [Nocardioides sp.]|uniref:HepT-like ribonuclease domain-containing protein n=1 Tax=Nocardioides sp. TaxID=35761 RepID=UPI003D6B5199